MAIGVIGICIAIAVLVTAIGKPACAADFVNRSLFLDTR
jgi:branched-subunit amino acid permease